jgi:hypothetical protein
MGNFLSNLLKVAIVGGVAYGAYKFGEHEGEDKGRRSVMSDADKEEIDHLKDLIDWNTKDFQVRLNLVVESVQTSTDLKEGHRVPLFYCS